MLVFYFKEKMQHLRDSTAANRLEKENVRGKWHFSLPFRTLEALNCK